MYIHQGSAGNLVGKIQQRLKELGLYSGDNDEKFGPATYHAVYLFQQKNKLNADGIVGPATWALLFPDAAGDITDVQVANIAYPIFQREMEDTFGSPLDSNFRDANICFIDLGEFKGTLGHVRDFNTSHGFGFWGNVCLRDPIRNVFATIIKAGKAEEIVTYDGCYVVRNMRGASSMSMHAYGFAIDLNAATNPFNGDTYDLSDEFILSFSHHGFEWGGIWQSRFDPMHFQLAWTKDWRNDANVQSCRFPQFAPAK